MTRIRSAKTRQALLILDGVFDADNPPERLSLFDADGNQLDFSPAHQIPPGGTAHQVLAKDSDTDFDIRWVDAGGGAMVPAGGTSNQVLTKLSDADGDAGWTTHSSGFDFEGDWIADNYLAGAVVRYAQGLWFANYDAVDTDVPGGVDTVIFQDSTGSMTAPHVHKRLLPDEEYDWSTPIAGEAGWDHFFFDIEEAGTITLHKGLTIVGNGWWNMYYGSTGALVGGHSDGRTNFLDFTLAVGRYYILLVPESSPPEGGTLTLTAGTATIGLGNPSPWELLVQGITIE